VFSDDLDRNVEEVVLHNTNKRAHKKAKKSRKDWLTRLLKICLETIGRLREWREEVDERHGPSRAGGCDIFQN
jgi:hypothetical protein